MDNTISSQIIDALKRVSTERDHMIEVKSSLYLQIPIIIGIMMFFIIKNIFVVVLFVIGTIVGMYFAFKKYSEIERQITPYIDVINPNTPTGLKDALSSSEKIETFRLTVPKYVKISGILKFINSISIIVLLVFITIGVGVILSFFC